MSITNEEFLAQLAEGHDGQFWTTNFTADPFKTHPGNWKGSLVINGTPVPSQAYSNNYFSVATFTQHAEGRRKADLISIFAVVLDDIKDAEDLPLPYTYENETSPDNSQVGYALKPGEDPEQIDALVSALAAKGYKTLDQNGNNIVRYVRLPVGCNTKAAVIEHHGEPFECHLHKFSPHLRYTVAELAKAFEVELTAQPSAPESRFDPLQAISDILSAENYHGPQISLAMRWVNKGIGRDEALAALQGMFEQCRPRSPGKELERWKSRYKDIPNAVDTAIRKREEELYRIPIIIDSGADPYTRHEWPPGFSGELAKAVHKTMEYPNKEIAILDSLLVPAGLAGRKDSFQGLAIRLRFALLAVTGVGKETINKTHDTLLSQVDPLLFADCFRPFGGSFGMGEVIRHLGGRPSCLIIESESGVANKSKSGDPDSLKAYYMQNQVQQAYQRHSGKKIRDVEKFPHSVNFTLLQESTKEEFKHMFDANNHASGASARQLTIFVDHRPDDIETDEVMLEFPSEIVAGIEALVAEALREEDVPDPDCDCTSFLKPEHRIEYRADEQTAAFFKEFRREELARRQQVEDDKAGDQLWAQRSRYSQQVKVIAFLLARTDAVVYGREPVVTWEHTQYAIEFVREVHRAELANASDYDCGIDIVLDALVKEFHRILDVKPNKHYNEIHGKRDREARKVRRTYLSKSGCKAWKLCKENRGSMTEARYLDVALDEGVKRGFWKLLNEGGVQVIEVSSIKFNK